MSASLLPINLGLYSGTATPRQTPSRRNPRHQLQAPDRIRIDSFLLLPSLPMACPRTDSCHSFGKIFICSHEANPQCIPMGWAHAVSLAVLVVSFIAALVVVCRHHSLHSMIQVPCFPCLISLSLILSFVCILAVFMLVHFASRHNYDTFQHIILPVAFLLLLLPASLECRIRKAIAGDAQTVSIQV